MINATKTEFYEIVMDIKPNNMTLTEAIHDLEWASNIKANKTGLRALKKLQALNKLDQVK